MSKLLIFLALSVIMFISQVSAFDFRPVEARAGNFYSPQPIIEHLRKMLIVSSECPNYDLIEDRDAVWWMHQGVPMQDYVYMLFHFDKNTLPSISPANISAEGMWFPFYLLPGQGNRAIFAYWDEYIWRDLQINGVVWGYGEFISIEDSYYNSEGHMWLLMTDSHRQNYIKCDSANIWILNSKDNEPNAINPDDIEMYSTNRSSSIENKSLGYIKSAFK